MRALTSRHNPLMDGMILLGLVAILHRCAGTIMIDRGQCGMLLSPIKHNGLIVNVRSQSCLS
ncbi:MAG: hypothetical protein ACLQT6_08830 [Desulfomonilaceae bacterium]